MMAQFVDENYWMQRAEEEAKENRMLKHQHGSGACVMFALDTSASMQGTAFEQMKKVFTDIINEYARGPMDENVAVVTFGEDIKFVHYYSNNYRSIRKCLDDVECKGASPIEAAIKMCLSGLCLGGGHTASIGMFELRAKLILITDGKPTSSNMIGEVEDKDIMDPVETRKSLMNFVGNVGRHTALNCIPVGEDPDFCLLGSISYSSRGGRLIQPEAAVQYGRYHFNMKIADEILSLGIMPTKCSRDHLELTMHSVGIKSISTDEDLDDILEMINEREAFKPLTYSDGEDDDEGENCEYNSQMPPVGTRVRRGPDWRWGNQDRYGPGTVVSHSERFGWLRVVWDAGASFPYRYGRNSSGHLEFFDLIECDEPRVLNNELIAEGCLVERGADWQWEEQDGGRGNIGVVYKVKYNAVVYVRWPNANKSNYRFGYEGKFDVRLCDPYDPNVVKRLKQQREAGDKRDSSDDTNNITKVTGESKDEGTTRMNISAKIPVLNEKYAGIDNRSPLSKNSDSSENDVSWELEADKSCTAIWQFKDEDGQWKNFPKKMNQKIDTNYRKNKRATVLVNIKDSWFRIVLSKMQMIDIKTRETTDIRYLED